MNNIDDDIDVDDSNLYQLPSLETLYDEEQEGMEDEDYIEDFGSENFNDNLAKTLPESTLQKIAGELLDAIEDDFLSRKEWEVGLKEALENLGMKVDKKEFPFPRACGVYSQVMMQAVMEFYSNAVAELLPLEGPFKELIIGDTSDELEEQSKRVETFVNYYMTQIAVEYYADYKKMLTWVPWVGITIRKVYFDPILKRPTSKFFKPQDFVVNYGTTSLSNCWRMTEVVHMNPLEFEQHKNMGIYRDVAITPVDELDESSEFERALDRSEGVRRPAYDKSIDYEFYECHTFLDFETKDNFELEEEDTKYRPYRITIHKETYKILAIYRNWEEEDPDYKRVDFYVDYGFFEGFGFYKLGAAHLIGGIATACTTLLRQYIDGLTLSNFPGGMYVKGSLKLSDNNIRIGPTEFIPIDTGGLSIQDAIMTMPYKEPSIAINETRKELEMAASKIMGAANAQMGEFNPNAPVGTTYAYLDVIHLIQSTVVRSLRDSMATEVKLFYKLFAKTLPEEPVSFDTIGGSSFISASDFSPNIRLVPVADPHVTTKMQRLMRAQTIVEMSNTAPDLYDRREAQIMYLKEIKLTESAIKKLLPDKEDIPPVDPVTENQNLMMGKPVKAFIDQDHASHLTVLQNLISTPDIPPPVLAAAMAHGAQHKGFEFQLQIQQMTGMQIPAEPENLPPEVQNQIAMMAAQAVQQMQQQQQQEMPPPPLDPAMVMLEDVKVKAKAIEQKQAAEEMRAQTEAFKAQLANEAKMKELEVKIMEIEQRMKAEELKAEIKVKEDEMRAQTTAFQTTYGKHSGDSQE
jgi:hypothetical protein